MSAFALRHNDNTSYAARAAAAGPDLKLSSGAAAAPAPTYIYNPVTEPGLLPPGITKAPPTIGALTFDPPEEITAKIIHDLARPEASMMDIAERASTTIEALTLWMSRPDISARLDAIESAYARHVRLNIASCTPAIIDATARIITEYHHNESDFPRRTSDPKAFSLACRAREIALDACKILLKLKREHTPPMRAPNRDTHRATDFCRPGQTSVPSTSRADQTPESQLAQTHRAPELRPTEKHNSDNNTAPFRPGGPQVPCRGRQPTEQMNPESLRDHPSEPWKGDTLPRTNREPQSPDSILTEALTHLSRTTTASPYPSASSPPPTPPPPESP